MTHHPDGSVPQPDRYAPPAQDPGVADRVSAAAGQPAHRPGPQAPAPQSPYGQGHAPAAPTPTATATPAPAPVNRSLIPISAPTRQAAIAECGGCVM